MLDLDPTQPLGHAADLPRLLDAVLGAYDVEETDWLEWKVVDPSGKVGLAKIARCVLAFANRDPADAARKVGGRGYMIVGAEPGNLAGVGRLDSIELERGLSPYFGVERPRWSPEWISKGGKDVLIVWVDAPRDGDPVYVARKDGQDIRDGAIYVRRRGESAEAKSYEFDRLFARADRGLNVAVEPLLDAPLSRVAADEDEVIESRLRAERRRLLAPMIRDLDGEPEAASSLLGTGFSPTKFDKAFVDAQRAFRAMGATMRRPEPRTREEYEEDVADYISKLRTPLRTALRIKKVQALTTCRFVVRNRIKKNYEDLLIELRFPPGSITAAFDRDDYNDAFDVKDHLPNAPRTWGPVATPWGPDTKWALQSSLLIEAAKRPFWLGDPANYGSRKVSPPRAQLLKEHEALYITFPVVKLLRSEKHAVLDDSLVLQLAPGTSGPLVAEWEATARNVDDRVTGTLTIPVAAADDIDLSDLLDELI